MNRLSAETDIDLCDLGAVEFVFQLANQSFHLIRRLLDVVYTSPTNARSRVLYFVSQNGKSSGTVFSSHHTDDVGRPQVYRCYKVRV